MRATHAMPGEKEKDDACAEPAPPIMGETRYKSHSAAKRLRAASQRVLACSSDEHVANATEPATVTPSAAAARAPTTEDRYGQLNGTHRF